MWLALLILCKFPTFLNVGVGLYVISPIYREIKNWDFECCSRLVFPIFHMMKEVKNWSFLLRDQSMLFTHLYLMLAEKIEAWFLSPASREYFGVESTAFLSASKFSKKIYPSVRWTAKYVFFISKAMKIAVSFSKFQWDTGVVLKPLSI